MQAQWYERLKSETGFEDIEDVSLKHRPLNEWHSFKYVSEKAQIIQATRAPYQERIEDFFNNPDFPEICKAMVKHGNCKFKEEQVHLIWELHIQGDTTRCIARKLGRSKSRIDDIIKGLIQWMNLIS